MKRFTQGLYGLSGVSAIGAGAIGLVSPALVLGDDASSGLVAHLAREQAAGFVFIGLMAIWCLRHYEQRQPVHYAFVIFTGLFAGIHWAGYLQSGHYIGGALVNTVPFLAFVATAPRAASA